MLGRNAQHVLHQLHTILTLILDVVDGQHRLDALKALTICIEDVIVQRHQSGLPVVGVDDVGLKADVGQHLQHSAGEECETLGVVIVTVQTLTLEIILVIQQIVDDAIHLSLEHAAILTAPCHRHGQAGEEGHLITKFLRNALIQRHHHAATHQAGAHSLGQGACHVSQTTGGGKRQRLAGNV